MRAIWRSKSDPNCNNNSDCDGNFYTYIDAESYSHTEAAAGASLNVCLGCRAQEVVARHIPPAQRWSAGR